jgi:rhamnose transport system ATP-binding protein
MFEGDDDNPALRGPWVGSMLAAVRRAFGPLLTASLPTSSGSIAARVSQGSFMSVSASGVTDPMDADRDALTPGAMIGGQLRDGNYHTPLCAAVAVTKRFGGSTALDAVSLEVRAGEVHAVVGENGAGKSTLMNVLHGLIQPDGGHVEINGHRVVLRNAREGEEAGIVMIPQELELFPDMSIAENLFVGRQRPRTRFGTYDGSAMRAAARDVFATLGVRVDVEAPIRYSSFASRQLTAIARALLGEARIVIMDEPTAALTNREAERLFAVIKGMQERGVGVIYVSHRLKEVKDMATRITVMRDGRRVETRANEEIQTDEMVRLMVGRPLERLFSRDHTPSDRVALEVRGLTRAGEFADISFSIRAGEIVGFAGLIGAGRTEVAQAIYGLSPSTGGTLSVDAHEVRIKSPQQAMSYGIAYVPEERRAQGLLLSESIDRNISIAVLRRISRHGFIDRAQERGLGNTFAQQLDVRGHGHVARVADLSGGNQQKVVIAKALATDPQILILDEPTRGVDVGAKAEIYRLIDELAANGKAILLISSELDEVLAMSDRILVMREGRLVAEFTHSDATPDKVAAAAAGVAWLAAPEQGDAQ